MKTFKTHTQYMLLFILSLCQRAEANTGLENDFVDDQTQILVEDEDYFYLNKLWIESCQHILFQQSAQAKEARDYLRNHRSVINFFVEKLSTLNNSIEFEGVLDVLNPLGNKAHFFYVSGLSHQSDAVRERTLNLMLKAEITLNDPLEGILLKMLEEEFFYPIVLDILDKDKNQAAVPIVYEKIHSQEASQEILIASCLYLGRALDEKSISVLMNLLEDPRYAIREAAIEALSTYGIRIQEKIFQLLESDNYLARTSAIRIFGKIGIETNRLQPMLLDSDRAVRAAAIRALRNLGMPLGELQRIMGKTEDPWIQGALSK